MKNKPHPLLKQGDIDIVHNDKQVQGLWKLAKIERSLEGTDGLIRGAVIRVPSKSISKTREMPTELFVTVGNRVCTTSDDPCMYHEISRDRPHS